MASFAKHAAACIDIEKRREERETHYTTSYVVELLLPLLLLQLSHLLLLLGVVRSLVVYSVPRSVVKDQFLFHTFSLSFSANV